MAFYQKIINAGTVGNDQKISSVEIRLVKLTNIFNLIWGFLSILVFALLNFLTTAGFQSYIRCILLLSFCILNIMLNHFHRYLPAKILTIYCPFIIMFVFPIFNQFIHAGMFLWFPYGIMIIGAVSFFVFSFEKEKHLLNFTLVFFAMAAIFYDKILLYAIPNNLDLSFIYVDNYFYYQTSKIILVCFLYTSLYLFKINAHKNQQELAGLNLILDQKNSALNYLNQNLEKVVKDRTEKLDKQNKRIKDLAFTNAHIVRASVAKIIGLVNLANDNASDQEKEFCYIKIRESALELDVDTDKISKDLIEET
ncbi:MAG TPA: hypothetical protein VNW99_10925 [Cytophagaceae bacterium]|jgi:hypothetical protein|nr:hypothetical protein [Cytophagaceae bacterium]